MMDRVWQVVGASFLIAILPVMYWVNMNQGSDALDALAVEWGYCAEAECSDQSLQEITDEIISMTEYTSMHQIRWCLGVDGWADTHVRKGAWLISPLMKMGYWACPDPDEQPT